MPKKKAKKRTPPKKKVGKKKTKKKNPAAKTENVRARIREREAVAMKIKGKTYQQIGDALGISPQAAHKRVTKALTELQAITAEDATKLRGLVTARLEGALDKIWTEVDDGNLQAVDRLVKLSDRLCKLWGADAPQQLEVHGMTHEQWLRKIAEEERK